MLEKWQYKCVEWLVRSFNVFCDQYDRLLVDWKSACVVALYQDKCDKDECTSFRGISMLSVVGKMYGKVPVWEDEQLGELCTNCPHPGSNFSQRIGSHMC